MHFRTLMLSGAAGLLLVGAPAFAQSNNADSNYNQNSTPAERAQTNELNTGAATRARDAGDANAAARDEYDAQRAAYERSLNDYGMRKAAYDNERARYDDLRHDYDRDRAQRWSAFPHRERFHDVLSLHADDLVGLTVSTRTGDRIGRIRDVHFASNGRVDRIAIDVGARRTAWVYADDVRYNPEARAILIDLSRDQVDRLARMRQFGS
ncbi:MAG: PRC-barrel domain-containing protein [Rhizomicrobium sp.]